MNLVRKVGESGLNMLTFILPLLERHTSMGLSGTFHIKTLLTEQMFCFMFVLRNSSHAILFILLFLLLSLYFVFCFSPHRCFYCWGNSPKNSPQSIRFFFDPRNEYFPLNCMDSVRFTSHPQIHQALLALLEPLVLKLITNLKSKIFNLKSNIWYNLPLH